MRKKQSIILFLMLFICQSGISQTIYKQNGKFGIIGTDSNIAVNAEFDTIKPYFYSGDKHNYTKSESGALKGLLYITEKNNKKGLVFYSKKKNQDSLYTIPKWVVIPCVYDEIKRGNFDDGRIRRNYSEPIFFCTYKR